MPGWVPFKACILLGQTEDWAKIQVVYDFDVTGVLVTAVVKDASTGVLIQALLAAAPCNFVGGVARSLANLGAPPWTPLAANKNAFLQVNLSGGAPAVAASATQVPCPVIDFPAVGSVAADDHVDGVPGGIPLGAILPPRGTYANPTCTTALALTLVDPGTDGDLDFTIANFGALELGADLVFEDALHNQIAVAPAAAAGRIGGLVNGVAYTLHAHTRLAEYIDSPGSAPAGPATPTGPVINIPTWGPGEVSGIH
jgi:hypothetical protein